MKTARMALAGTLAALLSACQVLGGIQAKQLGNEAGAKDGDTRPDNGAPADCHAIDPAYDLAAWPVPADGPDGTNYAVDSTGETVTDLTTGLMWQATTPRIASWQDAKCTCANLSIGGHRGWRLPSLLELMTIVDYQKNVDPTGSGTTVPAINTTVFKKTVIDYYWTASKLPDRGTDAGPDGLPWLLDFGTGRTADATTISAGGPFRCVRSTKPLPTSPRFAVQTDTVLDSYTSLEWQRYVSNVLFTSAEAFGYCQSLSLDGKSDWTLPSIKQLASLLDVHAYPTIDPTAFPNTPASEYAVSTRFGADPVNTAWNVDFWGAEIYPVLADTKLNVRCVRTP